MGGAINAALPEGFGDRSGDVGEKVVGDGRVAGTYGGMKRVGPVLPIEIPAPGGEGIADGEDVEAVGPFVVGGDGEELGLWFTDYVEPVDGTVSMVVRVSRS